MGANLPGFSPRPPELGGPRLLRLFLPVALLLASACGGSEDPQGAQLEGTTALERYSSLARVKGCTPPSAFPELTEACERLLVAWIDCVATDLDQCMCESDGDLNCEGSYKPDEGPALCTAEMDAFEEGGCDTD